MGGKRKKCECRSTVKFTTNSNMFSNFLSYYYRYVGSTKRLVYYVSCAQDKDRKWLHVRLGTVADSTNLLKVRCRTRSNNDVARDVWRDETTTMIKCYCCFSRRRRAVRKSGRMGSIRVDFSTSAAVSWSSSRARKTYWRDLICSFLFSSSFTNDRYVVRFTPVGAIITDC